jgi:hypothetical protein
MISNRTYKPELYELLKIEKIIFHLGKEEWVTVIFGEDGKEILTPVNPKQEKSVYDMEDEDFSATKVKICFQSKNIFQIFQNYI